MATAGTQSSAEECLTQPAEAYLQATHLTQLTVGAKLAVDAAGGMTIDFPSATRVLMRKMRGDCLAASLAALNSFCLAVLRVSRVAYEQARCIAGAAPFESGDGSVGHADDATVAVKSSNGGMTAQDNGGNRVTNYGNWERTVKEVAKSTLTLLETYACTDAERSQVVCLHSAFEDAAERFRMAGAIVAEAQRRTPSLICSARKLGDGDLPVQPLATAASNHAVAAVACDPVTFAPQDAFKTSEATLEEVAVTVPPLAAQASTTLTQTRSVAAEAAQVVQPLSSSEACYVTEGTTSLDDECVTASQRVLREPKARALELQVLCDVPWSDGAKDTDTLDRTVLAASAASAHSHKSSSKVVKKTHPQPLPHSSQSLSTKPAASEGAMAVCTMDGSSKAHRSGGASKLASATVTTSGDGIATGAVSDYLKARSATPEPPMQQVLDGRTSRETEYCFPPLSSSSGTASAGGSGGNTVGRVQVASTTSAGTVARRVPALGSNLNVRRVV